MAIKPIELSPLQEECMHNFAATLNEEDRRRFAALEASQRGHGGITYVARVLGCSTRTIERGIAELDGLQDDPAAGRVRREGAGRKKIDSETQRGNRFVIRRQSMAAACVERWRRLRRNSGVAGTTYPAKPVGGSPASSEVGRLIMGAAELFASETVPRGNLSPLAMPATQA